MSECSRCGECCRWMVIGKRGHGLSKDAIEYLEARADKEVKGIFLIDSPCKYQNGDFDCLIYGSRPKLCRVFKGKPNYGGQLFYVPEICSMKEEK